MASLAHEYDAAKRREYYLKTRQLVGRTAKKTTKPVGKSVAVRKPVKKTHAQRQKELETRVAGLQAKFARLQVALKAVIEAAQKRSGVDKNSVENAAEKKYQQSSKTSDPTSKYEKKTQKQKDAAAEAAQKYRDKNKVLEDQVTDLNNKIKTIRERIKRIQKTGSVGASKSTTQ